MIREHSFVVLAYGLSPYLGGCLASLRRQDVPSRILITTSTPSDHIDSTANLYDVPVIVNSVRENIAEDWNFALAHAQTRYVTLAHQDDVYAPDFLRKTMDRLTEYDGAVCFTAYDEIDDFGHRRTSKISVVKRLLHSVAIGDRPAPSARRMRAFLSLGNPLPCSSVTFDRARLPHFAFAERFASNLDWDAWWRLIEAGERFVSVSDRLVGRRHNELTATSGLIATGRRAVEDREMFLRIWPRPVADAVALLYRLGY